MRLQASSLLLAALTACGGAQVAEPVDAIPEAEKAEPDALAMEDEHVPSPATFTEQIRWGDTLFAARCAGCHSGEGGGGPPLFGAGALPREREVESVEREANDFVTAADVLDFVSEHMPRHDPGSLADAQYAAIVAYVLRRNSLGRDLGANDAPLSEDIADEIPLR